MGPYGKSLVASRVHLQKAWALRQIRPSIYTGTRHILTGQSSNRYLGSDATGSARSISRVRRALCIAVLSHPHEARGFEDITTENERPNPIDT